MEVSVQKIGDFGRVARVSVKTLRHYQKLGLLKPAWVDRFTGYRYYTLDQLLQLNRILALKDLGFSLEEVQQLLRDDLGVAEMRGMLRLKRAELERSVRSEQARLERIERRIQQIEEHGRMPIQEVVLKNVPPRRVLGIRGVIPAYEQVQRLFAALDHYLQQQRWPLDAGTPWYAIYYDVAGDEPDIEAEVAVPLTAARRAQPPAEVHELPGAAAMACLAHAGGRESLDEAYSAILAWIEANGFRVTGPTREVYLHEPEPAETGAVSVIDVQFPVERKPVSIYVQQRKERGQLEPKIVQREAFTVVGMEYRGKNENNEIKDMWDLFAPRMGEIKHPIWQWGSYGVCRDMPEEGGLHYLAGVEVEQVEDVPDGMTVWTVPEQTYAVFPCTLPTLHDAYRYAFEEWLPQSGYRRGDGPDFELYTEEFEPDDPASTMYIYVPIRK
jgi:predicted transcriptional regulator YdeE/DNA-binding transcriptional MerR regulator